MDTAITGRGSNTLADIVRWCTQLPAWQQDGLRRIVEHSDLTEVDIAELVALCKAANGLDAPDVPELRPLTHEHVPSGTAAGHVVTLCSIASPENVNALDHGQELKFAPSGLTVVFGYNGSGKSGYGRILRRACRARSTGSAILPNILGIAAMGPASAEITVALDGKEQKPEQWVDGQRPVEALGSVSFFDSDCAAVHIREKHTIAFTPIGLNALPNLGAACQKVQKQLDAERKKLEAMRPSFLQSPQATGPTAVGAMLRSLTDETDTSALDRLVTLGDAERQRLKDLPALLANDPAKQSQELRNRGRRIAALATTLRQALGTLGDESIDRVRSLASDYERKAKAAETAAQMIFSGDPLTGIGEYVWRELWEAARRYSAVVLPDRDFPVIDGADSACVLCQRPLDGTAKDRFRRFEAFVSDDTAAQAAAAKQALDTALDTIGGLPLRDESLHDQLLELKVANAALNTCIRAALAALVRRLRAVRAAKSGGDWRLAALAVIPCADTICERLEAAATAQTTVAQEVERAGTGDERRRLQTEHAELQAREWLGTVVGDVKEHVKRLVELRKLKACIDDTKTHKVTAKSKALAKEKVTDQLRDAFASEIKHLQQGIRRLNVELATAAGEYGSSYYQIRLIGAHDAQVEHVVSEGEHRCIALAGFLSELATQDCRSAIVFDDPVSSLDYIWSERFARRLVEEAAKRQVIVFTHDVLFLHDLCSLAKDTGTALESRHVRVIGETCGHIGEDLPNDLQGLKARMNALEQEQAAIRRLYDANGDGYELRVKQFYDRLRAAVERAVEEKAFNGVLFRFRNEIKVGQLLKVSALTRKDTEDLHRLHIKCSENMTGHDRAAVRGGTRQTPPDLKTDLEELRRIVEDLNARQNAV